MSKDCNQSIYIVFSGSIPNYSGNDELHWFLPTVLSAPQKNFSALQAHMAWLRSSGQKAKSDGPTGWLAISSSGNTHMYWYSTHTHPYIYIFIIWYYFLTCVCIYIYVCVCVYQWYCTCLCTFKPVPIKSHQKIQAHVHTQTCQKHLEDLWRRWACFWDNIFPHILFIDTDAVYIVMVYVYVFLTWASPMNIRYQSGLRESPAPWSWKFDEDRPCDHRVYCGQDDETPQGRSRFYCHSIEFNIIVSHGIHQCAIIMLSI